MSARERAQDTAVSTINRELAAAEHWMAEAIRQPHYAEHHGNNAVEAIDIALAYANDLSPRSLRKAEKQRLQSIRDKVTGPDLFELIDLWNQTHGY